MCLLRFSTYLQLLDGAESLNGIHLLVLGSGRCHSPSLDSQGLGDGAGDLEEARLASLTGVLTVRLIGNWR